MATEVKLWKIQKDNRLKPVEPSKLNLEEQLERWLEEDISIVDSGLLVIGRQVPTEHSGPIDLLCLDSQGDTVIIELKRDKTPREVTAQALDYASWVKELSHDQVLSLADSYLQQHRQTSLEVAFREKFYVELPDVLNESHSMVMVAAQIDPASERIIKYLSDTYGVGINAVTFQHFRDDNNQEYLARVFLIKPSQVEAGTQTKGTSKRRANLSLERLEEIANDNGVGAFYKELSIALEKRLRKSTTLSSVGFAGIFEERRKKVVFNLIPTESNPEDGLRFQIYLSRFANYFNTNQERVQTLLPENSKEWHYANSPDPDWSGFEGFFRTEEEVKHFVVELEKLAPG